MRAERLRRISELYGLRTEDLTRPFIRGFLDSLAEKGR